MALGCPSHFEGKPMGGIRISVRAVPNASRTEVVGRVGDAWKMKVQAVPEDGRANRELVAFLAKRFGVRKGQVSVVSGEKSRNKIVEIDGVNENALSSLHE